ncbi:hypothetical protein [Morganella morganii]|uniref:hypothetical protein n=1 Tax=Morganella morganii TaxID=582 RepID=UPI001C45BC2C|nr:hypothetical protein [Morganella morganii]QXO72615.1 hypothetical protein JC793_17900 [Morganella morganii]
MAYCNDFDPMDQFYCRDGEIMDISEEVKARIYTNRRIIRFLRKLLTERKTETACKPYTGLGESIYYQCADSEPSVETAMSRIPDALIKDIAVTSYHGAERAVNTLADFPFPVIDIPMSFLRNKRLSGGYQIMKENAEAIYLLRFLADPYENFKEAIEIIVSAALEDMPVSRRKMLNNFFQENIIRSKKEEIEKDTLVFTNDYIDDKTAHYTPIVIGNSVLRKYLVTAISSGIIAAVTYKFPDLFSQKELVIKRSVVVATLLYSYGTIEKMARAAQRLKERNYAVYQALDRAQLSLIYYFLEDELANFVLLAAKPSGRSADEAFVQEVRSLIARYSQ